MVEKGANIKERIIAHAKDGAGKYTGEEENGRVFIDAREQPKMNEKLAQDAMREAFRDVPRLQEIRIVGKGFDIGLKRGLNEITRR